MKWDIIVIGAGAAGLMAAGTAASRGARVLLLEKMERPARKLRITGKGRCNITNLRPAPQFLEHVRANREFFAPSFAAFDNVRTEAFFHGIGLPTVRERGERLFPASGRAQDVADALVRWCRSQDVEIACGERAIAIEAAAAGAVTGVKTDSRTIGAAKVVLCTGGVSYPLTGSTGDGYRMAHRLGHAIEPLRPSLVALRSPHPALQSLQGLALKNVRVTLLIDSRPAGEEFGEVEFTRSRATGRTEIAGPVTLRLSRDAVDALADGRQVELSIDLKPALSHETLTARIVRETAALPGARPGGILRKLAPAPLAAALARGLRIDADAAGMAVLLKDFRLPVSDHAPFEEAVVTAGGIDAAQVDPRTLESLGVRGLYFAGEVLDLDADTGGYNLQIAFSTGRMAGLSAAGFN